MNTRHCLTLIAVLVACTENTPAPPRDVVTVDAVAVADVVAMDLPRDMDLRDGGGVCSFNRDCIASERCACTGSPPCRCVPGARGAGPAGAVCSSGDDCESALCVEANGGVSRCSPPCDSASECPVELPRCISVSFVGRICARDPSMTTGDAGGGTSLMAVFGSRRGGFERAQHGRDGADGVHVEAHSGGDPACPSERSPTPRRTLVITGVRASRMGVQTEADGVVASLLDFAGELVSAPVVRATAVRVTPASIMPGASVSFEVQATFPGGTIQGTIVAPHCASLD